MGIRIDGNNDLIKAVDDTLTIEGISVNTSGMVTATGGIKVGTAATIHSTGQFNIGVAHTLFANGNATHSGIVTASSFVGSGANLTGITQTTINTNADNRVITGSDSANTLNGESNFTFDGLNINQSMSSNGRGLIQTASGDHYIINSLNANRSSANDLIAMLEARWNSTHVADISFHAGSDTTNKDDGYISLRTSASAGGISERVRIQATGEVGINATDPAYELVVKASNANESILQILAGGNGKEADIYFGAPDDADVGQIVYDHNGDHMKFIVGTSEIFRANSNGICLGGTGSANGLSDYEEGSFTPVLLEDGSTTYSQQNGKYTKIGNRVYFNVYIKINSHDGSSSSATGIDLPFQNDFGTGVVTGTVVGNDHWDTNLSDSNMAGWMGNGSTTMRFYKNSGLNLQAITVDDIGDGGEIAIAGHYPTNS